MKIRTAFWFILKHVFKVFKLYCTGHIETRYTESANYCDINGKCYTCPENCENCTYSSKSGLSCDTCKPGYYEPQCNKICSHNCHDRECKKGVGECSNGCVVGYYGYGCHLNCPLGCKDGECNQDNGFCSKECVNGYYGHMCELNCSLRCQDMECSKDNGACHKGCVAGHYGHFCEHDCPVGFEDIACNIVNGVCCKGCATGFHGQLCNVSCSNACRHGTCHRLNGTCTHGCIEGYYGETCHIYHTFAKEMSTPLDTTTRAPRIMESVLCAALVLVVAVLSIVLIRRRCMLRAQSSGSAVTDRRYDDIMGISFGVPTHTAVGEGQRTNESSGSADRLRLYGNILDRNTEDSAHNASLNVERGTYELLGNPDDDDNEHVYETTV